MAAEDGLMVFMEQLLKSPQGATQLDRARAAVVAVEARDRASCLLNKLRTVYKQVGSSVCAAVGGLCASAISSSLVFFLLLPCFVFLLCVCLSPCSCLGCEVL